MNLYWIYSHQPLFWLSAITIIFCICIINMIAAWYAAKMQHKKWFIVINIVPSAGVLAVVYLLRHCRCKE